MCENCIHLALITLSSLGRTKSVSSVRCEQVIDEMFKYYLSTTKNTIYIMTSIK